MKTIYIKTSYVPERNKCNFTKCKLYKIYNKQYDKFGKLLGGYFEQDNGEETYAHFDLSAHTDYIAWEIVEMPENNNEPQIGDVCLFYDYVEDKYYDLKSHKGRFITTTADNRFVDEDDTVWKYCEKIKKTVTVVKKASEIIKWCEEHGYEWSNDGFMDPQNRFNLWRWVLQDCGKEVKVSSYWHEDWLEEKEI